MKKIQSITLIATLLLVAGGCSTQTAYIRRARTVPEEEVAVAEEAMSEEPELLSEQELVYHVAWNRIPVGSITARIKGPFEWEGREVYKAEVATHSNRFLSRIFRVEDVFTSYMDAEDFTSIRFEADRKEGSFRRHTVVTYDHEEGRSKTRNLTDGSVKYASIEPGAKDPLSAVCYFMQSAVSPGEDIEITVHLNEENYQVYVSIEPPDEIYLPPGRTELAFKVQPFAKLEGEPVEKGRAWIYLSADRRRIPLFGVARIPFGRVTATLVERRQIERVEGDGSR